MKTRVTVRGEGIPLRPMTLRQIEVGQYFTGSVGTYTGLFVKTYDGTVNLKEPKATWSITSDAEVTGYVPISSLTITVGQ